MDAATVAVTGGHYCDLNGDFIRTVDAAGLVQGLPAAAAALATHKAKLRNEGGHEYHWVLFEENTAALQAVLGLLDAGALTQLLGSSSLSAVGVDGGGEAAAGVDEGSDRYGYVRRYDFEDIGEAFSGMFACLGAERERRRARARAGDTVTVTPVNSCISPRLLSSSTTVYLQFCCLSTCLSAGRL